ncbi:STAS domain-containing protein [Desulfitibacter alkalitolerans]|uniref:STAS domain-containing protein n=1 Tax=Desulfitibacter alkalitolerans TaxID=264641 RepID=UPI00054D7932|nr:anti-sigma factor antagonist [Desulfitibacter alkalitolerans]
MLTKTELLEERILVNVAGELDLKVADKLRTKLDELISENPGKELVLDFSNVNFIDSSGLGVLLGRYKKMLTSGTKIYIKNVQPQVKRVLELSGITRLINVTDQYRDVGGINND